MDYFPTWKVKNGQSNKGEMAAGKYSKPMDPMGLDRAPGRDGYRGFHNHGDRWFRVP